MKKMKYSNFTITKTILYLICCMLFFLLTSPAYAVDPYIDNGDGTVLDESTGLMWQQTDDSVQRNWEDSCQVCQGLELAGYDDWRVPRVDELRTIVEYDQSLPAIDSVFLAVKTTGTGRAIRTLSTLTMGMW